jgi:hypothetical protein
LTALREHSAALILLGQVDEARPIVDRVLESGEKNAGFLDLCRRYGLLPDERGR